MLVPFTNGWELQKVEKKRVGSPSGHHFQQLFHCRHGLSYVAVCYLV